VVEILLKREAAMVVSPSCGTNGDVCEDTMVDGGHWTITK